MSSGKKLRACPAAGPRTAPLGDVSGVDARFSGDAVAGLEPLGATMQSALLRAMNTVRYGHSTPYAGACASREESVQSDGRSVESCRE